MAVWGSLGSGKTTLLRVAAGLDRADEGEVRFDGRRIAELTRDDLQMLRRHEIGFADRSGPFERELTALDHVAFPLMGTMRRAESEGMAVLMTAPDAAATLGAHAVYTLSGGELQPAGPSLGGDLIRLPGA